MKFSHGLLEALVHGQEYFHLPGPGHLAQESGPGVDFAVGEWGRPPGSGPTLGAQLPELSPEVFAARGYFRLFQLRGTQLFGVAPGLGPEALFPDRLQHGTQGFAPGVGKVQAHLLGHGVAEVMAQPVNESYGADR